MLEPGVDELDPSPRADGPYLAQQLADVWGVSVWAQGEAVPGSREPNWVESRPSPSAEGFTSSGSATPVPARAPGTSRPASSGPLPEELADRLEALRIESGEAPSPAQVGLERRLQRWLGSVPPDAGDIALGVRIARAVRAVGPVVVVEVGGRPGEGPAEVARELGVSDDAFRAMDQTSVVLPQLMQSLGEGAVAFVFSTHPSSRGRLVNLWVTAEPGSAVRSVVWSDNRASAGRRVRALGDPPIPPMGAQLLLVRLAGTGPTDGQFPGSGTTELAGGSSRQVPGSPDPSLLVERPENAHRPGVLWVGDVRIGPGAAGLSSRANRLWRDDLVRIFQDREELETFAAGRTNHLGNLPGPHSEGTWVRFSPTGTNIIAEDHTFVTLVDVLRAVRPARGSHRSGLSSRVPVTFLYEAFPKDDLTAKPLTRAAFGEMYAPVIETLGIQRDADLQHFGGESLIPKLGWVMISVVHQLRDVPDFVSILSGHYLGQVLQRYLKVAWAYAGETRVSEQDSRMQSLSSEHLAVVTSKQRLIEVVDETRPVLAEFMAGLSRAGHLGESLIEVRERIGLDRFDGEFLPVLKSFAGHFIEAIRARVVKDSDLTDDERRQLAATRDDQELFAEWRNLSFLKATRQGIDDQVNYIGMGRLHAEYLMRQGVDRAPDVQVYDLSGEELRGFEDRTWSHRV
jgi:hypothetical protein